MTEHVADLEHSSTFVSGERVERKRDLNRTFGPPGREVGVHEVRIFPSGEAEPATKEAGGDPPCPSLELLPDAQTGALKKGRFD
jgi:hypothetical protein